MTEATPLPQWTMDSISSSAMKTWCTLLRDDNPIHLDPTVAQALGFGPRTVNPGPANLSYLLNMLMQAVPDRDITQIEAQFLGNALAGDMVHANGVPVVDMPGSYDTQLTRGDTPLVLARITVRGTEP